MPLREIYFYFRDEIKKYAFYELSESRDSTGQESRIRTSVLLTCNLEERGSEKGRQGKTGEISELMSNSHSAVLNQSWRNINFTSGSRNIIVSSSNIMFAPFRIPFAWSKPVKYGWVYFRRRNTILSLFRNRKTCIGMDIMISVIMLIYTAVIYTI